MLEKDWGQKEKRASEDEIAGWYHWCNGHELGKTPGDGEGQRVLACCSPWSCKELDMVWLNNNNNQKAGLFKILKDDAIKVLHSVCQQIWKTQQWPQDWKRSVLISIPKKGRSKECSNHWTIALISHASKVMLKILQVRLQCYVNRELPDVQAGFRKGRGTRDQIANIRWVIEKAREFQRNIYLCFIDYIKAFDCGS